MIILMSNSKYILIVFGGVIAAAAATIMLRSAPKPVPAINKAQRIVSAAPQLTEILYALGLEDKIAAVSSDSDYPGKTAKKQKIGTFWQLSMETIIAARPDLVVMESFEQQRNVGRRLEQMGYAVLTVTIDNISQLFIAIEKIGKATGCQKRAAELSNGIRGRLVALSDKLNSQKKCSVLWVMQTEPVRVAGRETFPNELIELAGGYNAIGPTVQKYPPIGVEQILACGAEIIIQPASAAIRIEAEQKAAEEFWSKWPSLPAVKNHRIYVVEPDTVSRLGPRLDKGLEVVGKCLHPNTK